MIFDKFIHLPNSILFPIINKDKEIYDNFQYHGYCHEINHDENIKFAKKIFDGINKKNSNLFGSIHNNLLENVVLSYNFSADNNFDSFDYHSLNTKISLNNFVTQFNFIEENGEIGSTHTLSNKSSYEIDKNNFLSFSTRRNKEINLTEYYNLTYEYKNDCLTAGIKYNKNFYQDNDLKPTENLFFTLTLIPLTTYERTIYDR